MQEAICPQAFPGWENIATAVLSGQNISETEVPPFTTADIPPVDPRTSEDCLFLDVIVPTAVYENQTGGAPVVVWVHSGGYVMGYKDQYGHGVGLVTRSQQEGSQGVIFVAINYRLGLFGWLAGSAFKGNASTNLGLLDQRFALEWIQKYIHKFSGDPTKVTVDGESSGGGSILSHITSYGGSKGVPFSKAITQSPYLLAISPAKQESVYRQTLDFAGANSSSQLANLSTAQLQLANSLVVGNAAPYGTFPFGPVVDGKYLPDLPGVLLAQGNYTKSVRLITSHCSDEGLLFTSPFIDDNSEYSNYLQQAFPGLSPVQLNFITTVLYPADFSGYFGYTTQMGRTNITIGDVSIVCNARYLDNAFPGRYAYEFTVPPSTHAEDTAYLFYDSGTAPMVSNATLAILLQRYITRFAETGSPTASDLPPFVTNENGIVENLNSSYIREFQSTFLSVDFSDFQTMSDLP